MTPEEAHKHYEKQFRQMEAYFQRFIEQRASAARAAVAARLCERGRLPAKRRADARAHHSN